MRRISAFLILTSMLLSLSGCYTTYKVPEENMLHISTSENTSSAIMQEEIPHTEASVDMEITPENEADDTPAEEVPLPSEIAAVEYGHISLTEVSPDQLWVDYSYTDAVGTTDPAECGDCINAAIAAFMQTEDYKKANDLLLSDDIIGEIDSLSSENYYTFDGENYLPVFECAFIDDFDCDGQSKQCEQFILLKFPYNSYDNVLWRRHYLIFVDNDGNAQPIDSFYQYSAKLLDYGFDKQLLIGGAGYCGNDAHTVLWGVINGAPKELYNIKGSYEKHDCFLTTGGVQGLGDFMYYDTSAKEYRAIVGDLLDKNEVYAMDTANSIPYDYDTCHEVSLVGGKYYLFSAGQMDSGKVCTFENGKFVSAAETGIRNPNGLRTAVKIPDIDTVLAKMVTPSEAQDTIIPSYAVIAQLDIDENTVAVIDTYYNSTTDFDGQEWYNGSPYLTIKNRITGEVLTTEHIGFGMAGNDEEWSPETAQLAVFEVARIPIIAAAALMPDNSYVVLFFGYEGMLDGNYKLTYVPSLHRAWFYEPDTLDFSGFTVENTAIIDNLGFRYEVRF